MAQEEATHPFQEKYWSSQTFAALDALTAACGPEISVREASLRWLVHHSALSAEHGDAVILGCSSVEQLEENIDMAEGGALGAGLVEAFEEVHDALTPVRHFLEMQGSKVMEL